jgi:uroporphyrinogen decarboxylase
MKGRAMMLPKERVLAAVARETPDRTPCDFWAEPPALSRLLEYLDYNNEERLLTALNVDIRHLNASPPPECEVRSGVYQNFWGERYVYQPTPWGKMREDLPGALTDAKSLSELESFPWPTVDCFDYSDLKTRCRRYGNFALLYGFADVWQRPALVRGWEGMFFDMAERPDWVHFLGRKFTDFYIEDYTRAAEISRGKIDIYLLISDLGSQNGPLVSLAMFRRFIAPYLKEMINHVHSLGALVLFHSCGAIHPFIPDLISLGIDVLDPIQPIGPEMTPERLKADFGDRLSFHGGIDMQQLLPNSTPEQVRREARRYSEILGRGGGYILAPAHLFQPDVPPENILALYK